MLRLLAILIVALLSIGCSCGDEDGSSGGNKGPQEPPPRISTHPPCVISADCPAGQHCDLGECVQDCNVESACESGST